MDLNHDDKLIDMLAVAQLVARGTTQIEIARLLKLGQATVSRLADEARVKRYLREEVKFTPPTEIDGEILARVEDRASPHSLRDKLTKFAVSHAIEEPTVHVFNSGGSNVEHIHLREFSRRAAALIEEFVLRTRSTGICWGQTMWNVVTELRNRRTVAPRPSDKINIIPLSGEPLSGKPTKYSSSILAAELGRVINGDGYDGTALSMVPAFVPAGPRFSIAEQEGIRKLITLVGAYSQIFVGVDSEVHHLDMILTSVGPASQPLGYGLGELLLAGDHVREHEGDPIEKARRELQRIILGDIGGVCIPRAELKPNERAALDSLRERWTGIKLEHLASCASRSRSSLGRKPGVVVVAVGAEKAEIICHVLKYGLISHLIIDHRLERALEQWIDAVGNKVPRQRAAHAPQL